MPKHISTTRKLPISIRHNAWCSALAQDARGVSIIRSSYQVSSCYPVPNADVQQRWRHVYRRTGVDLLRYSLGRRTIHGTSRPYFHNPGCSIRAVTAETPGSNLRNHPIQSKTNTEADPNTHTALQPGAPTPLARKPTGAPRRLRCLCHQTEAIL